MGIKHSTGAFLAAVLAFGTAYTSWSSEAQACRCPQPELTHSYARSDVAFRGTIMFAIQFQQEIFALAAVDQRYKGCEDPDQPGYEWLSTSASSASCGVSFQVGQQQIYFANQDPVHSWAYSTSTCAGNRDPSSLNVFEQDFLDSRPLFCDGGVQCSDGSRPFNCFADPCQVSEPCDDPTIVRCVSNYCQGCRAEYVDASGALRCQPGAPEPVSCRSNEDCEESEYCNLDGVCAKDATCNLDAECNLQGNSYPILKRCMGYGECQKNRCVYTCGHSSCVNQAGYDFGDCDMYIGWVVQDGTCVHVSSGCDSLAPGFPSQLACELACDFGSNKFACGDKLGCDRRNQYCLIGFPGVEPPNGESGISYSCRTLPGATSCRNDPSCQNCFGKDQLPGQNCEQGPEGGLSVSVYYP